MITEFKCSICGKKGRSYIKMRAHEQEDCCKHEELEDFINISHHLNPFKIGIVSICVVCDKESARISINYEDLKEKIEDLKQLFS